MNKKYASKITWPEIINNIPSTTSLIYSNLNKMLNNSYYIIYRNKTNDKKNQIHALIKEVMDDKISIEDLDNKVKIFKCNICNKIYWGKFKDQKDSFVDKTFLQEGQKCNKTINCKGRLIKGYANQPKNLIISNIINILDDSKKPIILNNEGNMINKLNSLANVNFISLAQFKNKKKKEYEEFKKRVWTPNNEATYDYWANLYGKGMTPEDTEQRQDFADAMIKNN